MMAFSADLDRQGRGCNLAIDSVLRHATHPIASGRSLKSNGHFRGQPTDASAIGTQNA